MARLLRLDPAGAVSHPTSRGNARPNVVFAEAGFELFLGPLSVIVRRYD